MEELKQSNARMDMRERLDDLYNYRTLSDTNAWSDQILIDLYEGEVFVFIIQPFVKGVFCNLPNKS